MRKVDDIKLEEWLTHQKAVLPFNKIWTDWTVEKEQLV